MKVRMRLMREWLITVRFAFRRMRFLACGVFAMKVPRVLWCPKRARINEKAAQSQTAAPTRAFPYSERGRRSTSVLAPWAVKGGAPALDDSPDRAAAGARLSFPV